MTPGPLSGILVLDLTRVLAGPYCTMMLAELGARVIKVENPACGDDSRQFAPFFKGKSAYYLSLNRGKESIALNLKDDADRTLLLEMARRADVVVENFRPGTLDRLGLGYAVLQLNPRLVCFGLRLWANRSVAAQAAYDMIVQAQGGLEA